MKYSKTHDHSESNLVVICVEHHDEAHTHHELSQNLTPDRLRDAKRDWLQEISKKKNEAIVEALAQENKPTLHYLYFIIDDEECPECNAGVLKWDHWGPSPFNRFSAWFKCTNCGDLFASQEQFE